MSYERWRSLYESQEWRSPDHDVREVSGLGVLLTAGHASAHVNRESGLTKAAEVGTGPLAIALAEASGAAGLVLGRAVRANPNHDEVGECSFKQRVLWLLSQQARVVLDLHGMRDEHGVDVCLGEGLDPGGRIGRIAVSAFEEVGLRVVCNDPFDARRSGTVTRSVQEAGGDALQIEIARSLRGVEYDEKRERFFEALCGLANSLGAGG